MRRKGTIAGLALIACVVSGAVSVHAVRLLGSPFDAWSRPAGSTIRIALPPVEKVALDELTERDMAVLIAEAAEDKSAEPKPGLAAEPEPRVLAVESSAEPVAGAEPGSSENAGPAQAAGLLVVRFDLADADRPGGESLDVRKAVRFNGSEVGTATIRVGNGTLLFIASEDLRSLLVAAKRSDIAESLSTSADEAFVGFDEARAFGLGLRYDPLSDQILISG